MHLTLQNRQRKFSFDLGVLRQGFQRAFPLCLAQIGSEKPVLAKLDRVDAVLLPDVTMIGIHREFFQDPSPTDVITFPYGEILLGAGMIAANANRLGHSPEKEALLCLIHGLLHLNGFDDLQEKNRMLMQVRQEEILEAATR